jgi:hypothetical protein
MQSQQGVEGWRSPDEIVTQISDLQALNTSLLAAQFVSELSFRGAASTAEQWFRLSCQYSVSTGYSVVSAS